MPDNNDQLLLYEALELRAEYESRIKTLQDCLPEAQKSSNRFGFNRDDQVVKRPSADFDPSVVRKTVKNLEYKHRKLNSAVQVSNFTTTIEYDGDKINLMKRWNSGNQSMIRLLNSTLRLWIPPTSG